MKSPRQWLVPFKGRNHSGSVIQNFLWREGNVWIMDNHRAAMWCWLQDVPHCTPVRLLHIDEHYDTLYSRMGEWLAALPALSNLTIEKYLALEYQTEFGPVPLVRWDTYLSIFLERYGGQVREAIFATQGVGDKPRFSNATYPPPNELPENIAYWLAQGEEQWIVNIDLDYFFCNQNGTRKRMYSNDYINAIFVAIRDARAAGRVASLTICLTPDEGYTGGWPQAEALCAEACEILGVTFSLPST
jgi:hypothetical protein